MVLGVAGGIGGSRVIRSAVIGIKENDYFLAARAVGTPTIQILNHHVLPNIMAPVIIIFSINIGGVIVSLASLGFLGYGLPPTIPDWGGMLSREGRKFMEQAPWLALWPGLCLTIVVYSFNMFGDAVRDLLDPRLRGSGGVWVPMPPGRFEGAAVRRHEARERERGRRTWTDRLSGRCYPCRSPAVRTKHLVPLGLCIGQPPVDFAKHQAGWVGGVADAQHIVGHRITLFALNSLRPTRWMASID